MFDNILLYPIIIPFFAGLFSVFIGLLLIVYEIIALCINGTAAFNWGINIFILLWLLGGLILLSLGIIGEYIVRIYDESKGRPFYIKKKETDRDEKK